LLIALPELEFYCVSLYDDLQGAIYIFFSCGGEILRDSVLAKLTGITKKKSSNHSGLLESSLQIERLEDRSMMAADLLQVTDSLTTSVTALTGDSVSGTSSNDILVVQSAQAGDSFTYDGGDGSDLLDLTNYLPSDITFQNSVVTVDLGSGQSFDINLFNVETIQVSGDGYLDSGFTVPNISIQAADQTAYPLENVTLDADLLGNANIPILDASDSAAWISTDIGTVGATGSTTYDSGTGTYTIQASGNDIWGNQDEFHLNYQQLHGDGEIIARVDSLQQSHSWAKAGVMIRESLDVDSFHAMMIVSAANGTAFQRRVNTGGSSANTSQGSSTDTWVKLSRVGDQITGSTSSDGVTWADINTVTIEMNTDVFIGLAVTSHKDGTLTTAEISNINLTGGGAPEFSWQQISGTSTTLNGMETSKLSFSVPNVTNSEQLVFEVTATAGDYIVVDHVTVNIDADAISALDIQTNNLIETTSDKTVTLDAIVTGDENAILFGGSAYTINTSLVSQDTTGLVWGSTDIGDVATNGSSSFESGTFTIGASGNDIWNKSDEFQMVYQEMYGDGVIVAQVDSIVQTNNWAKAGVMIRESLTDDSTHAFMTASANSGISFQRRTTTGGNSSHTTISGPTETWVKLTRIGDLLTGAYSSDGINWTDVGTTTITMGEKVYVGLGVTSHNAGAITTAEISNVSISTISWKQISGTAVTINNQNSYSATVDLPELDTPEQLVFEVTATTGNVSATELVTINVDLPYAALAVDAGNDVAVQVGETLTLSAKPNHDKTLDFNTVSVDSYAASQDVSGTVVVEDNGSTLHLTGNNWKKIDFDYTITADTVLEFDFKSNSEGEVHAIGFDNDDNISAEYGFKLYGTQQKSNLDHNNYSASEGEWVHYKIRVGELYTGNFDRIYFENDHDISNPNAESIYSNLKVYEDISSDELTYQWSQVSGPAVTIKDFDSQQLRIHAPYELAGSVLTFKVTAFDGVTRRSDFVTVQVEAIYSRVTERGDEKAKPFLNGKPTYEVNSQHNFTPDFVANNEQFKRETTTTSENIGSHWVSDKLNESPTQTPDKSDSKNLNGDAEEDIEKELLKETDDAKVFFQINTSDSTVINQMLDSSFTKEKSDPLINPEIDEKIWSNFSDLKISSDYSELASILQTVRRTAIDEYNGQLDIELHDVDLAMMSLMSTETEHDLAGSGDLVLPMMAIGLGGVGYIAYRKAVRSGKLGEWMMKHPKLSAEVTQMKQWIAKRYQNYSQNSGPDISRRTSARQVFPNVIAIKVSSNPASQKSTGFLTCARDVSTTGLGFICSQFLEIGKELEILLTPEADHPQVQTAKIVRNEKMKNGVFVYGAEFESKLNQLPQSR